MKYMFSNEACVLHGLFRYQHNLNPIYNKEEGTSFLSRSKKEILNRVPPKVESSTSRPLRKILYSDCFFTFLDFQF